MTQLAFSNAKFDTTSYASFRPTYGNALFEQLLTYHRPNPTLTAIDIGCGTGQITTRLAPHFDRVIGFDPSEKMISSAAVLCDAASNVTYRVASAESVPVPNESVDLITVGQAAHWFHHESWFIEMSRILKRNGTLSFWSYNEAVFTKSRDATEIWNHYSHASDKLGPHWPQPGRSILENAMDGVEPPATLFRDVERHYTAQRGSSSPSQVAKSMRLSAAEAYFRTSSSFHNWQAANPGCVGKGRGGEGDLTDEMVGKIKERTGWTDETIVEVHWPTVAVLARKK